MTPAAYTQIWNDYAQSLRLWAIAFMVWLAEVTRFRTIRLQVRCELRFLRREVRHVLVARMAAVCHADARRSGRGRTDAGPFAFSQRRFRRFVVRGVVLRTFEDAKRVLDNLDAYALRCIANFRTGMKRLRRRRTRSGGALAAVSTAVGEHADAPYSS